MQDEIIQDNKWEFNSSVTQVFDNMLERSIPQYEIMRNLCTLYASQFINLGNILDIGCSLGTSFEKLAIQFNKNKFIGYEISDPMIQAAKEKFSSYKNVEIIKHNLKYDSININNIDVVLSILTIQFTPIEYRLKILKQIYQSLNTNGCFIFVEKVIGSCYELDDLHVKIYYDYKKNNNYTQEQIERKRIALEGVLVPVTYEWNNELLKASGFNKVDSFWRCMNFSGWIAIK